MMNRDYEEFKQLEPMLPPKSVSESLLARVCADLHPSAWKVFSKLALIHFFTALGTLSLCPQFGWRLFGDGMGLMQYFSGLGDTGCGVACGSLFLGSSLLIATFLLRPEEVRRLRKNRVLELGALTLLSLGFFVMIHAEIAIGFLLAWLVGSVLGGIATLELGWVIRLKTSI
jgi:hypothetical protein